MKRISIYLLTALSLMTTACKKSEPVQKGFHQETLNLTSNKMTPEVLWKFGRLGGEVLSPDKKMVLYGVTYFNIEENKGYTDLYLYNFEDKSTKRITDTRENESDANWRPDGKKISYISSKSGTPQLWEMNLDGTEPRQISFIEEGINGYIYSPDGKKVLFAVSIKLDKDIHDLYPDLPKANARLENDIMYRHWDSWSDYTYSHILIADYNETGIHSATDIMKDERYDTPMKPFGGMEQISWSPDCKTVAYTCKKMNGKEYSLSTNSEIWLYNLDSKETKNISKGMMGYDQNPTFSPDGNYLAWESMERDGYESDQSRLVVADLNTGAITNYFKNFEESAHQLSWASNSKTIYFISDIQATEEIFSLTLADGKIERITNGIHDYQTVYEAGDQLVARKVSMSQPAELYIVDKKTGEDTPITTVNKAVLDQLLMGKVEKRWVKTTDNKDMLVWVILPPNFDPAKKYPALLYCEGGPQSTVSQFWSYRWNFQMMAANDYIIVAPNRRGLPGFGKEWLEQISKDYGGQNIKDYLTAIDVVSEEPYIDKNRLGAIGASYGGYSVYYLAGNHQKRFKTFIAHCGIFNFEQLYSTTEEMWFANWDYGGAYWDKKNAAAQRSYTFSPHNFVQNWDTPILVIHGEKDFRIPYTQGMGAFNSAILKGIPAQFLLFPDENHWVLKPQDGILWQRVFFNWLDKWLK